LITAAKHETKMPPVIAPSDPPGRSIEVANAWAGDLIWCGGRMWVAWSACLDPEPELLAESHWDWPLRREQVLLPGTTVEDWRRRSGEASFTVSVGLVDGDQLTAVRDLTRTPHAIEGPALAAVPGVAEPAVLWAERRGGGSVLLAQMGGAKAEVVLETPGAILGPRLTADASGKLVAVWQQWPSRAESVDAPRIMTSMRSAAGTPSSEPTWSPAVAVSPPGQSAWSPAVACGAGGQLWCAWDGWNGNAYAVYLRAASPDGAWQETVQVSPPGSNQFHIAPDVASGADTVWVVWSRSARWGETNHRFNHLRFLHAAEVTTDATQGTLIRPAPGTGDLGEVGQLPVSVAPFLHSVEEEFVNPVMPKIRIGVDGQPVVFYRQFRSATFKDFGWSVWATRLGERGWTKPALLSQATGFPDTPYGVASMPASEAVAASGEGAVERWWLASHAGDYPRYTDRHPSRPVRHHRLVVEPVHVSPAPAASGTLPPATDTTGLSPVALQKPKVVAGAGDKSGSPVRDRHDEETAGREITVDGHTYTLLYGDLHRHSAYSKCMSANDGDPLDHWRWVQDVAGLDFYALTEHLEYMSYLEWRRIEDLAERLAAGGRVLALCGWELAIPPGHTNFFYADQAIGQDLRIACLSSVDLTAVWPKLDAWVPLGSAVAIRHHQGHRGDALAPTYAPQWEPVVEIVQTRGEYPDWVQSLWRQGFHVGVAGASDHARGAPFVQCLTGLWIPPAERTRQGVLTGLLARRTFATNGVRMGVFLSATGEASEPVLEMGASGTVRGAPRLRVEATGTSRLETVEFYRNDRLLHVETVGNTPRATVEYVDNTAPAGEHAYWVRVIQGPERNGRRPHRGVAYSSPVWATVEPS
jgi:hypothetical protein